MVYVLDTSKGNCVNIGTMQDECIKYGIGVDAGNTLHDVYHESIK